LSQLKNLRESTLNMSRTLLVAGVLAFLLGSVPAYAANPRNDAKAQVDFGIAVAQRGLWREAIFRWKKAVEIDPTYAAAWNNLAIAYEHEGQFESARDAYERALKLDPTNNFIHQNYDFFKEINDRAKRGTTR
jgi:Tfp pilus assembly protein PilF